MTIALSLLAVVFLIALVDTTFRRFAASRIRDIFENKSNQSAPQVVFDVVARFKIRTLAKDFHTSPAKPIADLVDRKLATKLPTGRMVSLSNSIGRPDQRAHSVKDNQLWNHDPFLVVVRKVKVSAFAKPSWTNPTASARSSSSPWAVVRFGLDIRPIRRSQAAETLAAQI